jgi:hypothetical protein
MSTVYQAIRDVIVVGDSEVCSAFRWIWSGKELQPLQIIVLASESSVAAGCEAVRTRLKLKHILAGRARMKTFISILLLLEFDFFCVLRHFLLRLAKTHYRKDIHLEESKSPPVGGSKFGLSNNRRCICTDQINERINIMRRFYFEGCQSRVSISGTRRNPSSTLINLNEK